MKNISLLILLIFAALPSPVSAQGQPYVSAFSSYQHTTDSLLSDYGRQTEPLDAPFAAASLVSNSATDSMVVNDVGPYCGSPVTWEDSIGLPAADQFAQPRYFGHSITEDSAPGWSECQTCPPAAESVCAACCDCLCDERGRTYAFETNAVFLYRQRPASQRLFFNPSTASEHIDASQFEPGMAPGVETAFTIYDQRTFLDIEFRTMWLDDWTDQVNQSFSGPSVQIASDPILGTTGPRNGAAFYSSQLGNIEINGRYRLGQGQSGITLVGGFRYVRLNERLNATLADPAGIVPDELVRTQANNGIYGVHWGVDSVVANTARCCLKLDGRIGLFGNQADQRTQLISLSSPAVTFTANGKQGDLAFLVEAGVSGKYRLTSWANLTAGYRAIFIDGLALAPEQLGATSFLTSSGIHTNGSLMLHAATAGLEIVY